MLSELSKIQAIAESRGQGRAAAILDANRRQQEAIQNTLQAGGAAVAQIFQQQQAEEQQRAAGPSNLEILNAQIDADAADFRARMQQQEALARSEEAVAAARADEERAEVRVVAGKLKSSDPAAARPRAQLALKPVEMAALTSEPEAVGAPMARSSSPPVAPQLAAGPSSKGVPLVQPANTYSRANGDSGVYLKVSARGTTCGVSVNGEKALLSVPLAVVPVDGKLTLVSSCNGGYTLWTRAGERVASQSGTLRKGKPLSVDVEIPH